MTTIRKIVTSKIDGNDANSTNTSEIRPFGEAAIYIDGNGPTDKLVLSIHDGVRTHQKSKVVGPGVLYGSNADAGDGSGADTIKLIPDAGLGTDQYIVVDPTGGEPGHIHLRAGGTQDASSADLYLGGELTCVRVSDTSGIVTVRTTSVGDPNITKDWAFESDGNLYFPGIGNNRIGESEPGLVVSSDNNVVLQSNNGGESKEWAFGTDGSITLPNNGVIRVDGNNIEVGNLNNFNVEAAGVVNIYTATDAVTPFQWQFGDNGELAFPDNAGQINSAVSDGPGLQVEANGDFEIKVFDSEDTAIWSFEPSGSISFPDGSVQTTAYTGGSTGDITFSGDSVIGTEGRVTFGDAQNTVAIVSDQIPVKVQINDALGDPDQVWLFGVDGSVTFPDSTVQTSAWTKRIVAVPTSSTGTTGDLQGDLAFNATYMYYCTQNFSGTVITIASISSDNPNPYLIMYDSNTGWTSADLTGYTVTGPGGYTGTVTGPSTNQGVGLYYIPVTPDVTQAMGDYTFTSPSGNIWKRVAWSGDTW